MFEWHTIEVTPLAQNCRILWDVVPGSPTGAADAVVVDPGGDVAEISAALRERDLRCAEIWLTHSHFDHCGGVAALKEATGALLRAHPGESFMRKNVPYVAGAFGLSGAGFEECPEPDEQIVGGETLRLGATIFRVLFTPGHSPGHVSFYDESGGVLLSGDVLFLDSIGRTDLPGGDHGRLLTSIREEVLSLPDETVVLPGHGPDTTVGREREWNPFLAGGARG